jgi:LmbE family N-acetylglucosaminyl deacetylase
MDGWVGGGLGYPSPRPPVHPSVRPWVRCLAVAAVVAATTAGVARAQLAPPSTGGVVALDRLLQQIGEPRRVLMIGAHPDDEDTQLLALAALGYGARTAYLSLSRGEGGQNLIGEELGAGLGLIRTRELLAARATDGAQQFFTRAFDFGYSKTLDETLRFWPIDSVLKDAVRIIRYFRPQIVISVFSGTPRDGHGQHQEAGVVARRAFAAAGDSTKFPELYTEEGLRPWQPLRLYQSTRFDTTGTTIVMQTGTLDPRSGRSYWQIAMASRSRHRSQEMGQLQRMGPAITRIGLIKDASSSADGDATRGTDLFEGIPAATTWLTSLADSLRGALSADRLAALVPPLAAAVTRAAGEPQIADSITRRQLGEALATAAGTELDALADSSEYLVPGDRVTLTLQVYNGGSQDATLDSCTIAAPPGWRLEPLDGTAGDVAAGAMVTKHFALTVPADAPLTEPYFLQHPRVGELYDWSAAPAAVRGRPFAPPPLEGRASLTLSGAHVTLTREVTYRYDDRASGEVRRPVHVVPAVDVRLDPDVVVWPANGPARRRFTVTLLSHAHEAVVGDVHLEVAEWPSHPAARFELAGPGATRSVTLELSRPAGVTHFAGTVEAVATAAGQSFATHVAMIEYPHIRPTPYLQPAAATLRVAPIVLPHLTRVGYIRGASDRVPEALEQVGVPITLLTPADLADGDLQRYDAIVVGSRAYQTDTALVHHNARLLRYADHGGLVLVQYQQYPFIRGDFAPYALTIARPHDRVTDETAPVKVLLPGHPALTTPNKIDSADWEGWPQERGLYFAHTWAKAYTPLLEMHDPGDPPLEGGLLVARLGAGTYVYTGLSFFRALPAGAPGAYRLFLNLLALGAR